MSKLGYLAKFVKMIRKVKTTCVFTKGKTIHRAQNHFSHNTVNMLFNA